MVYIGLMVFYLACFLQHAIWKEKVVYIVEIFQGNDFLGLQYEYLLKELYF